MFDEIIKDLKKIIQKIEKMDDPTAEEYYREAIGLAHWHIEECINVINEI